MQAPRLNRYDIVEEIGRGGMSVVFRARDRQLHRDVAVKVLHQFLASDPDARKRFRREAMAVAQLRHPSILEIYDSSEPGADEAYLVTELIHGQTLRDWYEAKGVPEIPEAGALVVLGIARALRHAHENGIIHRDLKPENVMVTPDGHLKLMDFGIAQIMDGATRLTQTGTLLGSPAHMAPEVIDGEIPDHRADLFSLGTILYWMITGALPFEAPNPSALFRRILEGEFEPPQLRAPKLGNRLARVVEKALEPRLSERYQDISELERDLEREIEAVGWTVGPALTAELLSNPDDFCARRRGPLVGRLLEEGEAALAEGDLSRAVDRFNRVLAFEPEDARAGALLAQATRPRRRPAGLWLAAGLAALTAGVALPVTMGWVDLPGGDATELAVTPRTAVDSEPREAAALEGLEASTETEERTLTGSTVATPSSPRSLSVEGVAAPSSSPPEPGIERSVARTPAASAAADQSAERPVERARPRRSSPRRPTEPEAPPAEMVTAAPPEPALPATARLRIRIGQSFADVLDNGAAVLRNTYGGVVKLDEGEHLIEVVHPSLGRFRPRRIELTASGDLFELSPGGAKTPVGSSLDFRIPLSAEEAARTPGWVPAPDAG